MSNETSNVTSNVTDNQTGKHTGNQADRDPGSDAITYRAVLNHEEQYSIWPASRELPAGWRDAGKAGSKAEVLAYIEEVWTDMRPLSLRRAMGESPAR